MNNDKLDNLLDNVKDFLTGDAAKASDTAKEDARKIFDEIKLYDPLDKVKCLTRILGDCAKIANIDFCDIENTDSVEDINAVAFLYLMNNEEKEAFEFLNKILNKNPGAPVHMSLGDMYYYGIGVSQDFDKATNLYKKAVVNGEIEDSIIEQVSVNYLNAGDADKDINNKAYYYENAFRYGNILAGVKLGDIELDSNKEYDFYDVFNSYESAARHGKQAMEYRPKYDKLATAAAFSNMGYLIVKNERVNEYPQALKYFNEAASLGLAQGQFHVGYMYLYGLGVEEDREEAIKWFTSAANLDCQDAIDALEELGVSRKK